MGDLSNYIETNFQPDGLHLTVKLKDFVASLSPQDSPSQTVAGQTIYTNPVAHAAWQAYQDAVGKLFGAAPSQPALVIPYPPGYGAAPPAPPALNPQEILNQIVAAINAAEQTLHVQNFVIASGTVQAQLNLPGLNGSIAFNITPKPYS